MHTLVVIMGLMNASKLNFMNIFYRKKIELWSMMFDLQLTKKQVKLTIVIWTLTAMW